MSYKPIAPAPSSTPGSSTHGPGNPVPTGSVPSPSGSVPGAAMKPPGTQGSQSTYTDLLSVIEEMGKEIQPTYAGSKNAMERLKRGIIHAWALVRECLAETERNACTQQEASQPQRPELSRALQSTRFSLAIIPSCTSHPGLPVLCPLVGALQEPKGGSHSRWQH
uniref:Cyclin-dependent kinase 2-associated protein n=1 Tax=Cebus imitator TaxID=2715852 RepID=A0A2K5PD60_CEBIM